MRSANVFAGIGAVCLFSLVATPVLATLITFDDLPSEYRLQPDWADDHPESYDPELDDVVVPLPLTNQYEHLGVLFGVGDLDEIARNQSGNWGAGIATRDVALVSPPNAIGSYYAPAGMSFTFIGDELPDYVSFYVSAPAGAMSAAVFDQNGMMPEVNLGWEVENGEFNYTDAPIRHFLEFTGDGIKEVQLSDFFGHRSTTVYLDNLYFGATRPIPEPAILPLLMSGVLGLGILAWRRKRSQKDISG